MHAASACLTLFSGFGLILFINCQSLQLLVPLYMPPSNVSDPSNSWHRVGVASASLSIIAIINVDNGPGHDAQPSQEYINGIKWLHENEVLYVGLVDTMYGHRNMSDIESDVTKYANWHNDYRVKGIYFDQAANDEQYGEFYRETYKYTHHLFGCRSKILTGQGTNISEEFFRLPLNRTADTAVVFEDTYAKWLDYTPNAYQLQLFNGESAAIIHTCQSIDDMKNAVRLAIERKIGYIYVTNLAMNNPYSALPSYFDDLVRHLVNV